MTYEISVISFRNEYDNDDVHVYAFYDADVFFCAPRFHWVNFLLRLMRVCGAGANVSAFLM